MRLLVTNKDLWDTAALQRFSLDLAYGDEENDFRITVPYRTRIEPGSAIYVPGTEWGGIVREPWVTKDEGRTWRTYWGQTWHGMMAERILYPDPGVDYLVVSGDANDIIRQLVHRVGLEMLFDAAPPCGIIIPRWRFDHDSTYLYGGLRKMLASFGCTLSVYRGGSGKVMLAATPGRSWIDDGRGSKYGYQLKMHHPINHLKCLGKGDLAERIVIDLYADRQGNVSQVQTIFGLDLREETYDSPNADYDQLLESGTKHLRELQVLSEATLALPAGASYNVDDVVGIDDSDTGISIRSSISKVTVKVDATSTPKISNEMKDVMIRGVGKPLSVFEGTGTAAQAYKASMLMNYVRKDAA